MSSSKSNFLGLNNVEVKSGGYFPSREAARKISTTFTTNFMLQLFIRVLYRALKQNKDLKTKTEELEERFIKMVCICIMLNVIKKFF